MTYLDKLDEQLRKTFIESIGKAKESGYDKRSFASVSDVLEEILIVLDHGKKIDGIPENDVKRSLLVEALEANGITDKATTLVFERELGLTKSRKSLTKTDSEKHDLMPNPDEELDEEIVEWKPAARPSLQRMDASVLGRVGGDSKPDNKLPESPAETSNYKLLPEELLDFALNRADTVYIPMPGGSNQGFVPDNEIQESKPVVTLVPTPTPAPVTVKVPGTIGRAFKNGKELPVYRDYVYSAPAPQPSATHTSVDDAWLKDLQKFSAPKIVPANFTKSAPAQMPRFGYSISGADRLERLANLMNDHLLNGEDNIVEQRECLSDVREKMTNDIQYQRALVEVRTVIRDKANCLPKTYEILCERVAANEVALLAESSSSTTERLVRPRERTGLGNPPRPEFNTRNSRT